MHAYDSWSEKGEQLRTEYRASQNIITLGTFLLGLALFFIRIEGSAMTYPLLILLFFFSPLLILFTVKSTQMVWYYKLRRWIWHHQLIKKIEKELKGRAQNGQG